MAKIPGNFSSNTIGSTVTMAHRNSQQRRGAVYAAALANAPTPVTVKRALAAGSSRQTGPDLQAVAGYKHPKGKEVAEYLRRKRVPIKQA